MRGSLTEALQYIAEGAGIIFRPGYRRFIVVPLLINILLFAGATLYVMHLFTQVSSYVDTVLPTWLAWLSWLIGPLVTITFFVVYGYCFNIITNILAAPFFGLLAEKIESELTDRIYEGESLVEMIPRTLMRELVKLGYFLSRGFLVLLVFLAFFILPGLNIVATCVAMLWGCWCVAIQYSDYAADNHQLEFSDLRERLSQRKVTTYSFGGLVLLGSMIPLVNIVVSPIAVAGATIFWVRELSAALPTTISSKRIDP